MLKQTALLAHKIHNRAYSYYRVRTSSDLRPNVSLSSTEREFFLNFQPALRGENIVVYDIGAARGIVTQCLSKLPNVSEIHAFEPLPQFFIPLEEKMNSIQRVTCHNVAIGDESGSFEMNVNDWATSSSLLQTSSILQQEFPESYVSKNTTVRVERLDDYVKEHSLPIPNLVKVDVQGFEKQVIDGGSSTLKQCNYCVLEMSFQELYKGSALFDEIYRLMYDLGFDLIGLTDQMLGKDGLPLQVDGIFRNRNCS